MKYKVTINGLVEADNQKEAQKVADQIVLERYTLAVDYTFGVVSVEKVEESKMQDDDIKIYGTYYTPSWLVDAANKVEEAIMSNPPFENKTADNASIPAAGEIKVIPCHEKSKTPFEYFTEPRDPGLVPPHAVRVCQKCQVEQPEDTTQNQVCVFCQCPVVMWQPKGEKCER